MNDPSNTFFGKIEVANLDFMAFVLCKKLTEVQKVVFPIFSMFVES